jgi:hypothetical protein
MIESQATEIYLEMYGNEFTENVAKMAFARNCTALLNH